MIRVGGMDRLRDLVYELGVADTIILQGRTRKIILRLQNDFVADVPYQHARVIFVVVHLGHD